jgi:Glycosyltransferase family 92
MAVDVMGHERILQLRKRARAAIKRNRPVRAAVFMAQNIAQLPLPGPGGRGRTTSWRYQLAAMVRVKDEARFLPEWIAYHVCLGVEHCYVYDNDSTDDLAAVIRPFVEAGHATIIPWPTIPVSPSAHNDFLARFGPACRWVAFLDADEFLVERTPGVLRAVLGASARRPAVAVSSRYFGSGGFERIPDGLVIDRFDRANARMNDHVKVIARPDEIHRYRNPHNFYYRLGRLARTPDGRPVFGSFVRSRTVPDLVLHHYLYRSREDYERKARRQYPTEAGTPGPSRRPELAGDKFGAHNDVRVTVPVPAKQATARLLGDLGYPPALFERQPATVPSPEIPGP